MASAAALVMAVVVPAVRTVWLVLADVLLVKYVSPAYTAVRFFRPTVVKTMEQPPAATLPVQLCVPFEMVTLPVGVSLPGAVAATL